MVRLMLRPNGCLKSALQPQMIKTNECLRKKMTKMAVLWWPGYLVEMSRVGRTTWRFRVLRLFGFVLSGQFKEWHGLLTVKEMISWEFDWPCKEIQRDFPLFPDRVASNLACLCSHLIDTAEHWPWLCLFWPIHLLSKWRQSSVQSWCFE